MIFDENQADATALMYGNAAYPELFGKAFFMKLVGGGVLITIEVYGLPEKPEFLGMHIHEFGDCSQPFDKTGTHYNPSGLEHPMHAGDLPPLLNNEGYAYMSVFTDRFELEDVLGKSLIIHANRDDFTTQPSGDSGEKIACGLIHR